mmetsp:Transcript_74392/g.217885  ORF Transcript_74392/g.217885 Transcript_74392/m.217885 type:complete len:620 (+) Transcript_74392:46-1905(+)
MATPTEGGAFSPCCPVLGHGQHRSISRDPSPPPYAPPDAASDGLALVRAQLSVLQSQLQGLTSGQEALRTSLDQVARDTAGLAQLRSRLEPRPAAEPSPSLSPLSPLSPAQRSGTGSPRPLEPGPLAEPGPSFAGRRSRSSTLPVNPRCLRDGSLPGDKVRRPSLPCGPRASRKTLRRTLAEGAEPPGAALRRIFETAEAEEAERAHWQERRGTVQGAVEAVRAMDKARLETIIDSFMGFFILANSLIVGIQTDKEQYDMGDWGGWLVLDLTFSAVFLIELLSKLMLFGFKDQYCKKGSRSANLFDTSLIAVDAVQWIMVITDAGAVFDFDALRVVRLLRIGRILRLIRLDVFRDLLAMLSGMIGGMPTLLWSLVLFIIIMYVIALIFRELLGRRQQQDEFIAGYFDSVPRSMFTVFRCSFGDCSTETGVPIFELVTNEFGAQFALCYCLITLFVTIGLFNVISAIFVESTMHAAQSSMLSRKAARLQDETLWCTRIARIIRCLMAYSEGGVPERLSLSVDEVARTELAADVFDELVHIPAVVSALNDLDINPEDHRYLRDILDPDNSGMVSVSEMMDGLLRLRGEPRRSDIVAVDLMVRSIQEQVSSISAVVRRPPWS